MVGKAIEMTSREQEPDSAAATAVSMLRVQLGSVLDGEKQNLMLSSPYRSSEKSLLVRYLARCLAEEGRKVLVVESDPAQPALAESGDSHATSPGGGSLEPGAGVDSTIEAVRLDRSDLRQESTRISLSRWASLYDNVLVNGPPLLEVAEAATLAACCDVTLLVIESGGVGMRDLELTRTLLQRAGATVVGSVLAGTRGRS
jgi:Mrp family chromosome partitioning ATPase